MSASLHGETVVCLSTLDWDSCWQAPQEICSRLAALGARVVYVENTAVRSPRWGDAGRIFARLRRLLRPAPTPGGSSPVEIVSPAVLPFPYSPVARWLNRQVAVRQLARRVARRSERPPIVVTMLPTPFALDVAEMLRPAVRAYYCAARFADSSEGARRVAPFEDRVITESDLVMVISRDLEQHCGRLRKEVLRVPLGVSLEAFESAWRGELASPSDLAALPRPICGYVGGLHGVLDQDLLAATARRLPQVSFALVGPIQWDVTRLRDIPNVHMLGYREHAHVPAYMSAFDVCLIPYLVNRYSDGVYPSKLNEYLAVGKPVVATPICEIGHYNREHGNIVAVAADAAGFAERILEQLELGPARREECRRVALLNSWEERVAQIAAALAERLP